jgi:predicted N-acetyltransferase YhbS
MSPQALLRVYDEELRGAVELEVAERVQQVGPMAVATLGQGEGLVTSLHAADLDARETRELVAAVTVAADADPGLVEVEWKTRGHDRLEGLEAALGRHGWQRGESEAVMMGAVANVPRDVSAEGVRVRRVDLEDEADVRRVSAATDRAFGQEPSSARAERLVRQGESQRGRGDRVMSLWVAEVDGAVVGAGRLEPVPGTSVAGLWGGATDVAHRGRGVYRALVAARAHEAARIGATVLQSDCTPASEPILARCGFVRVTTTTPFTRART